MKRHTQLSAVTLAGLMTWTPLAAQAESYHLTAQDKLQLAQIDRRDEQTLETLKRDPARASLLSLLYPGLGQLYIGNDLQRSLIIMGGGTLIIAGSIVGFGLLSNRPAEASTLGNLLIVGVLVGYHLWNVRDAYVQAAEYNLMLEKSNRTSWLDGVELGFKGETLTLSWSTALP